jgi:hypothetical protein
MESNLFGNQEHFRLQWTIKLRQLRPGWINRAAFASLSTATAQASSWRLVLPRVVRDKHTWSTTTQAQEAP